MYLFFLYELSREPWETKALLLRVTKERVSSSNTRGEELAELVMERKRDALLRQVFGELGYKRYRLLGSFELSPEGEVLYSERGGFVLPLWYAQTAFGSPYIVLSQADTEEDFYRLLESDGDFSSLHPIYPAERVEALFYTERDCLLNDKQMDEQAEQERRMLYDSLEDSVELYMNKRFLQVFLEEGWRFEQVYEVLIAGTPAPMTAWYQINEDRPLLAVSYAPSGRCLSVTLKASRWAADREDTVFRFPCRNGVALGKVLKSIIYYRDWFTYDEDYRVCGYEEMIQKLAEQGITVIP